MPQQSWERGWTQRANRNLYEQNELIDALNMVPDPEGGGIATRLGDTLVGTTGGRVHSLYTTSTANGTPVSYQGAGTVLSRNFLPLVTGLSGTPISFATMAGFGEQQVYTFFANGDEALRLKDDGTSLTNWGLKPPSAPLVAGVTGDGGSLDGVYAWVQVYVRKPIIRGAVFGRYIESPGSYDLAGTLPFALSDGVANNGTVFGAPERWGEVVLTVPALTVAGGVLDFSYWNGSTWIVFAAGVGLLPDRLFLDFRNSFPFNAWVLANGYYLVRVRVNTAPSTMPVFTAMTLYDSVYAARSNPSPFGPISGPYGATPLPNIVAINFSNPLLAPDLTLQATHVAIYRTTGSDAALANPDLGPSAALYFFETDYPAGENPHLSHLPDENLGELLEIDHDRPLAFDTIAEYQGRLFGAKGNRLWFSKRYFPEAFPGSNFLDIGSPAEPIRRIGQYHGTLYIWTTARPYQLVGTDETSYDTRLVQCPTGLGAPQSVAEGERAIYFLGSDGHLWGLQGTIAANVSRVGHQQLFEGVTLHGVAGINLAALGACVGHWGHGRYLLSYPEAPAVVPTASLLLDETRGSWWRDSRAWQSLFYERQTDRFYGGLSDGKVVRLHSGLTDHGAAILGRVQTFDDDAQFPDSDKDLSQLTLEVTTSATGVLVTPVVSYDLAAQPLGTVISPTWGQHVLPSPAPGTFLGLSLGYVLTGVAPWALYSLLPTVLPFPSRTRAWQTLPSTFGWPGPKILDSLLLDVALGSGSLTWALFGDGLLVETGTLATLGRQVVQLLTQRHTATVFQLRLLGSGVFLLHDGSVLSFRPLPPPVYSTILVPTDLGTGQDKVGLSFLLDIDLLSPGILTITFVVDGTVLHTLTYSTVGRTRTERFRLPASVHGRLMEMRLHSTALYQLWPGSMLEWQQVGASQSQWHRLVQEDYGQAVKAPLLQLPHSEGR